jgi:hypothetical protein
VSASLEIDDIPGGGRRFTVRQGKWTPAKVALVPLAIALLFAIASYPLFINGYWTLALIAAGLAGLTAVLAIPFGIVLLALSLTLRDRASFSVTPDAIQLIEKNSSGYPDMIAVSDIMSIHHGKPRSSSDVAIGGFAGDIASLMGLALAKRSSAVWLNVRGRGIYLARQIRAEEALKIFNDIKSMVKL